MMIELIFIYKKYTFKIKIEIYHQIIEVITKNKSEYIIL